jgi:hypothetical protein
MNYSKRRAKIILPFERLPWALPLALVKKGRRFKIDGIEANLRISITGSH